jgi:glyceraldehyde-3-phosphate dehydrogenase (NADP+)
MKAANSEQLGHTPSHLSDLFPSPDQVPEQCRLGSAVLSPCLLLDGEVRRWEGELTPVSSPVCMRMDDHIERPIIGHVPAVNEAASREALAAAVCAWGNGRGAWPLMEMEGRIEAVEAFAAAIIGAREEMVKLLMWEIGKSLEESRAEIDRTIGYITSTIEAVRTSVRTQDPAHRTAGITVQVKDAPLGVCLLLGPFNNPVYETYTMVVPALLMGNTIVVKAPKFGVMVHQLLFQSLATCFPRGVVNFIYGAPDGEEPASLLMKTGQVDVFSFIGSTTGAEALVCQHPQPLRLRTVLSLGAKNAALIMADADISAAVGECVRGALGFNGQRCTALKILFVHESVADRFLSKFCDAVAELPIGMPWHKNVKITPLPEFGKAESMAVYVEDAVAEGGSIINAGGGAHSATLFRPAVIFPVSPVAQLYKEEQFGPVVPVRPYKDEEELLRFVASCRYGQQVSLFGKNAQKISGLAKILKNQVGRVNINCKCQRGPDILPFAGRRDSGMTTLSVGNTLKAFSMPSVFASVSGGEVTEK